MKWIKASERLPEETGRRYFVILKDNVRAVAAFMWKDKKKATKGFYKCDVADWNNYPVDSVSEWLDESPIKEESQDELWEEVYKIIHSTHRTDDVYAKLKYKFHITRK